MSNSPKMPSLAELKVVFDKAAVLANKINDVGNAKVVENIMDQLAEGGHPFETVAMLGAVIMATARAYEEGAREPWVVAIQLAAQKIGKAVDAVAIENAAASDGPIGHA